MVTLLNGNTLRFTCKVTHLGDAFAGARMYAAIGVKGIEGFNEKLAAWKDFDVTKDSIPKTYTVVVDVLIGDIGTLLFPGGLYEAYVKLISIPGDDIFWYGSPGDIELVSHQFSNLVVTYSKA